MNHAGEQYYDTDIDHAIAEKKLAGPLSSCPTISHWRTYRSTSTALLACGQRWLRVGTPLQGLTGKQPERECIKYSTTSRCAFYHTLHTTSMISAHAEPFQRRPPAAVKMSQTTTFVYHHKYNPRLAMHVSRVTDVYLV